MKGLLIGLMALGSVSTAFAQYNTNACSAEKIQLFSDLYYKSAELSSKFTIKDYLEVICDDGSWNKHMAADVSGTLAAIKSADYVQPKPSKENHSNDRRGRKTCYAYLKLDPYIVGTVGYRLYVEKSDGEVLLISTKKPGAIQGENTNQRSLEALIPGLEEDLRRNYICDNLVFEGVQQ